MNRLTWTLFDCARRLDWRARGGLVLLAGASLLQLAVTGPAQERLELQRLAAASRHGADRAERDRQRLASAPAGAATERFYQYFPARDSAPEWLDLVYQAAARQSVQLTEGEYKLVPGKAGKLLEYQISLPVKGSYAQVRRFVVQVLHEVPAASLDELVFRRDAIGSDQVETRIRLTLHMRSQ